MQTAKTLVVLAGLSFGGVALAGGPETTDTGRAYAAELKADAAARSSSLNGGGFTLADGDSSINVGGFAQFRYIMNFRDNPPSGFVHDSGFTNGFEATRTRLEFTGNIMKQVSFKIDTDFSKSGGAGLKDAWASYAWDNGWTMKWGQFKIPLLREELVSDVNQLSVERSIVNAIFTGERSQGVMASYAQDNWRFMGSLNDGAQNLNTPYNVSGESDYALTARGEWKWGDNWDRFNDFTSWQGSSNAGLIGVAAHWQHDGGTAPHTSNPNQVSNTVIYTADFSYEGNGWNMFAAFVGSHFDPSNNAGGKNLDNFGFILQGGVFVSANTELFARYDVVFPDSDFGNNQDADFHSLGFGVNHYVWAKSNAFKLSADVQYWPEKQSESAITSGVVEGNSALRSDSRGDQFAFRLQAQIVF